MQPPEDRNGRIVGIGSRVRLLALSGKWLDELPPNERRDVLSMIGEVFKIEEIDEYGHPMVRKSWPSEEQGTYHSHSVAVDPNEIELVDTHAP